ncbi:MAG: hypothetical protein LBD24_08130 [Spirochaetaceae bacterium]|jgi:hypothetical protein|nr:hypothetical protein [Spirochaetaceae bacterium]
MEKREKGKKRLKMLCAALLAGALTGCVSSINENRLAVALDKTDRSAILPLKNCAHEVTFYDMGLQVMEHSGFLNRSGDDYGYYAVKVTSSYDWAPNFFIIGFINGITLFTGSLFGAPTDLRDFSITAYLYIFNAAGDFVRMYKYTDDFTKIAGLYYGQDPNKKASRYYSRLFKGITAQAAAESDEINYFLREAGPVTPEGALEARTKITEFLIKGRP